MQNFKDQLPPLSLLLAFEAAARHKSFTLAARELNLTQAAVSQQIRNLENKIGIPLFNRAHKSVELSPRGREYQHTICDVLEQLALATRDVKRSTSTYQLTVACDQSIASMWLMPRLAEFQFKHPDISIRLISSDNESECFGHDIQISIIHGNGSWPGYRSEMLFGEEVFPVCSPEFLSNRSNKLSVENLVFETLIDLDDDRWNWMHWRKWFTQMGIHQPAEQRGFLVNSYPLLIDAAANGQGIALGWSKLVDGLLESSSLIRPIEESVSTDLGYYLVWPESEKLSGNALEFYDWCGLKISS